MGALDWLAKAFFVFSFCITLNHTTARAHPHVWIDLRSTVVLNAVGRVTAVEQQWLFDPLYTVFAIEGLPSSPPAQAKLLRSLATINLQRMHSHEYFTEVRVGGTKAALGVVSDFDSELRGGRLWMRFVVPLITPIDPISHNVEFAVYDPTYYIEILHLRDDVISFRGGKAGGCYGQIVPPNPTTEAIVLARAMDRDALPDATLGKVFAERVQIKCR